MHPNPRSPVSTPDQSAADAALASTLTIASVGIATLNMLETLLPAAANEVEHESKKLADNFTTLVEHLNTKCSPPQPIHEAIAAIVMGMQFQDRNTQVMQNVTAILERYRNMLEEICANIEAMRDGKDAGGHDIAEAVEHILSGIRLSEIRSRYMDALKKANVHAGENESSGADKDPDSVELF